MEPKIRAATAPDPPECTGIILPPGDEDWACAASVCQAPTTCSLRFSAPTRTGQSHGRRAKPRNASSSSRGQIRTGILSHRPTAPAGAASKPTLQTGLRPSEGSNVGSNTALGADSVPGGGKIRLAREKRVRSVVLSPTEFDDEIRQVRRRIVEEEDSLFTFQSPNCAFICVCVSKLRCLFGDGCCLFPLHFFSPHSACSQGVARGHAFSSIPTAFLPPYRTVSVRRDCGHGSPFAGCLPLVIVVTRSYCWVWVTD